jgi:hypothetical protein
MKNDKISVNKVAILNLDQFINVKAIITNRRRKDNQSNENISYRYTP